jgi:uncharacterized protein (TIGR03084 family)
MVDLAALLRDLAEEGDDADRLVADLPARRWADPTPAEGWTIAHQIGHLAWTDEQSLAAATDAAAFAELLARMATDGDSSGIVDRGAAQFARRRPAELLASWRAGRGALLKTLSGVPAGTRLPWFGPPMSPASMVTARIMETWAHGQDIADTLGVRREPTDRLRHVAHIGVRARDFAFATHGLTAPDGEFLVGLRSPRGELWTWGPGDAAQRITGQALDFCLLVTQRRHRADLDVRAEGPDADRWLDIAQAFAGPSGAGRAPGQFA